MDALAHIADLDGAQEEAIAVDLFCGAGSLSAAIEDALRDLGYRPKMHAVNHWDGPLDWVIVGGESGPHARPMHPAWPRSLYDQCAAAGVASFFFKQWGEWKPSRDDDDLPCRGHDFEPGVTVWRVGKKRAGRLLDGVEHNAFPEVRA
jgi:hypothetical protein